MFLPWIIPPISDVRIASESSSNQLKISDTMFLGVKKGLLCHRGTRPTHIITIAKFMGKKTRKEKMKQNIIQMQ
jgi:hypothetical protein